MGGPSVTIKGSEVSSRVCSLLGRVFWPLAEGLSVLDLWSREEMWIHLHLGSVVDTFLLLLIPN